MLFRSIKDNAHQNRFRAQEYHKQYKIKEKVVETKNKCSTHKKTEMHGVQQKLKLVHNKTEDSATYALKAVQKQFLGTYQHKI